MSLRIWLPLTKDLRNQGLDDVTVSGGTIDNNGKLGKCYLVSKTSPIVITQSISTTSEWTINFWARLPSSMNNATAWEVMFSFPTINADTGANGTSNINWASYHNIKIWDDTNHQWFWAAPGTHFNYDKWHMWTVAHTANGSGVTGKIYIDGNLIGTYNNATHQMKIRSGSITIGGGISTGGFYINDFRLYDHCLSPLEVKHIAQGLILHYPLNRGGLGPTNLLKNGFGELGIENWSYAAGMFSDVPENHPEIYHSYKNVESKEFIPIYRNHNYKFSTWIKTAASSGNSYPSICPYDADKHFIATNNCKEGFDLKTMTILTRELKAGDTKIYVEDLSKWNTNSGHYYDTAAIFGYKDGTGYVWPDGTYTRNCPAFSSGTEAKTNLDKTNNIITLLTAYNGVTIPIGTKICASTYGNTYFYPCGGISYSTITNWTFKENTFSSETPRLSAAKYIRVLAYSNCYQAGMTVTDLTMESFNNNIEYDCSGFCNNGTRIGTFTWTGDTSKYNVSTSFNGTDNAIQTPSLPSMISDKNYTIAVWIYKTVIGSKSYQTIYGGPSGFEIEARNGGANETKFVPWNWGKPMASYELNEWNHCVFVHSDSDCKIYLNGEYIATGTAKASNPSGNYFVGAWNTATQQNFEGNMSDFRIYATALSADDVKSLYQNSAYIDNQGNIYGAVYEEV